MQNLWDLRSKRVHVAVMRHGHVMIRVDAAWTRFMFELSRAFPVSPSCVVSSLSSRRRPHSFL